MNKQQIQAEHDRLKPILFEGAPDWFTHAAMDKDGLWMWHHTPALYAEKDGEWHLSKHWPMKCKNQPQTTLDWRNTLIERGDV